MVAFAGPAPNEADRISRTRRGDGARERPRNRAKLVALPRQRLPVAPAQRQSDPVGRLLRDEPILLAQGQSARLRAFRRDRDAIAGEEERGVGAQLAEPGVVRVLVDLAPRREAVLARDPAEGVALPDGVDLRH
jgi:hypothetical protein